MSDVRLDLYLQAAIPMFVITGPIDPVKILFFNTTIEQDGKARTPAALLVSGVVLGILVGVALIGRQLLEALVINLDAFRVVGGVVTAWMGFEMLYGGVPSKAQGQQVEEEGPTEDSGLIVPLSIPLIAGPGAIVTTICSPRFRCLDHGHLRTHTRPIYSLSGQPTI